MKSPRHLLFYVHDEDFFWEEVMIIFLNSILMSSLNHLNPHVFHHPADFFYPGAQIGFRFFAFAMFFSSVV